ncbi:MAG: cation transporter [Actinomycetes bacterium]|jgi:copper chaperone CopZ|nr:cation transporter [Actinomycetes bacterium]
MATETIKIGVGDMSCAHCESAVASAIRRLPGIKKAKASARKNEVVVKYDPTAVALDQIRSTITETGYTVL